MDCEHNTIYIYKIRICIGKLKAGKDDGDIGFKSDHIINGTHRLYVLLSLLHNLMFYHGHTYTCRLIEINNCVNS